MKDNLDFLIKMILILWLFLLSVVVHYGETPKPITKTVVLTPPTTIVKPYTGIRCMVDGYEVRTDLKSAAEAGCK